MLISFLGFFLFFTLAGVASTFFKKNTVEDYLLASRNIPHWMVGLSYGATISSGATFIGFAGLAYSSGLVAVCATVGLMIGDHIAWNMAGDKIRDTAAKKKIHTYPTLIGKLGGGDFKLVTTIASLLTVVFLGTYCAAQLVAGAKIGTALFDWDYTYFVFAGAGVLLAYCWAGGIRASIWTDAIQAFIILLSLLLLVVAAYREIGGFDVLFTQIKEIDPALLDPFQMKLAYIFMGWIGFGIGVLGQPQLVVRHMVAKSKSDIIAAKRIYLTWRWTVLALSVLSGFMARVLIPESAGAFDPELSIPALWEDLLPPVLVGFLVAGLFSATMSTADSLLLSASSALTQNLLPSWRNSYAMARLGTVVVIALTVCIALFAGKGVLALVVLAWGAMASALGPLMVVQLLGAKISETTAVGMMLGGFGTALLWRYGLELHTTLLDLIPGMGAGFAIFTLSVLLQKGIKKPKKKTSKA